MDSPRAVSRDEWLAERKALLAQEKEATRVKDAADAARRALPTVEIGKEYVFTGPGGQADLVGLFGGRRQLIVYHFMWRHVEIAAMGGVPRHSPAHPLPEALDAGQRCARHQHHAGVAGMQMGQVADAVPAAQETHLPTRQNGGSGACPGRMPSRKAMVLVDARGAVGTEAVAELGPPENRR
jgi:hypothetical protein